MPDAGSDRFVVLVSVVLVVHVPVVVRQGLVRVLVLVALGEVEPDPQRHEQAGDYERDRDGLAEEIGRASCRERV